MGLHTETLTRFCFTETYALSDADTAHLHVLLEVDEGGAPIDPPPRGLRPLALVRRLETRMLGRMALLKVDATAAEVASARAVRRSDWLWPEDEVEAPQEVYPQGSTSLGRNPTGSSRSAVNPGAPDRRRPVR